MSPKRTEIDIDMEKTLEEKKIVVPPGALLCVHETLLGPVRALRRYRPGDIVTQDDPYHDLALRSKCFTRSA